MFEILEIPTSVSKDCPFKVLWMTEENKYYLVLGHVRITDGYTMLQDIYDKLKGVDWNVVLSAVLALLQYDKMTTE